MIQGTHVKIIESERGKQSNEGFMKNTLTVVADTTPVAMYDMTPRHAAIEAIAFDVVLMRTL